MYPLYWLCVVSAVATYTVGLGGLIINRRSLGACNIIQKNRLGPLDCEGSPLARVEMMFSPLEQFEVNGLITITLGDVQSKSLQVLTLFSNVNLSLLIACAIFFLGRRSYWAPSRHNIGSVTNWALLAGGIPETIWWELGFVLGVLALSVGFWVLLAQHIGIKAHWIRIKNRYLDAIPTILLALNFMGRVFRPRTYTYVVLFAGASFSAFDGGSHGAVFVTLAFIFKKPVLLVGEIVIDYLQSQPPGVRRTLGVHLYNACEWEVQGWRAATVLWLPVAVFMGTDWSRQCALFAALLALQLIHPWVLTRAVFLVSGFFVRLLGCSGIAKLGHVFVFFRAWWLALWAFMGTVFCLVLSCLFPDSVLLYFLSKALPPFFLGVIWIEALILTLFAGSLSGEHVILCTRAEKDSHNIVYSGGHALPVGSDAIITFVYGIKGLVGDWFLVRVFPNGEVLGKLFVGPDMEVVDEIFQAEALDVRRGFNSQKLSKQLCKQSVRLLSEWFKNPTLFSLGFTIETPSEALLSFMALVFLEYQHFVIPWIGRVLRNGRRPAMRRPTRPRPAPLEDPRRPAPRLPVPGREINSGDFRQFLEQGHRVAQEVRQNSNLGPENIPELSRQVAVAMAQQDIVPPAVGFSVFSAKARGFRWLDANWVEALDRLQCCLSELVSRPTQFGNPAQGNAVTVRFDAFRANTGRPGDIQRGVESLQQVSYVAGASEIYRPEDCPEDVNRTVYSTLLPALGERGIPRHDAGTVIVYTCPKTARSWTRCVLTDFTAVQTQEFENPHTAVGKIRGGRLKGFYEKRAPVLKKRLKREVWVALRQRADENVDHRIRSLRNFLDHLSEAQLIHDVVIDFPWIDGSVFEAPVFDAPVERLNAAYATAVDAGIPAAFGYINPPRIGLTNRRELLESLEEASARSTPPTISAEVTADVLYSRASEISNEAAAEYRAAHTAAEEYWRGVLINNGDAGDGGTPAYRRVIARIGRFIQGHREVPGTLRVQDVVRTPRDLIAVEDAARRAARHTLSDSTIGEIIRANPDLKYRTIFAGYFGMDQNGVPQKRVPDFVRNVQDPVASPPGSEPNTPAGDE